MVELSWSDSLGLQSSFSGVFKLKIELYSYGLFKFISYWVCFGSLWFCGIDPFHLACQFYVCRVVPRMMIILMFAGCVAISVPCFIPDIVNLCL